MRVALALLAMIGVSACFIDFPDIRDSDEICSAGENVFCRCPGGAPGTRVCLDDGTSFGECVIAPGTPCGSDEPPPEPPLPPPEAPGTKDDPPPPPGQGGGDPGVGGAGGSTPDNCGDVDYFGECEGAELSWCNGGELVQTDCAATQKVCDLVSDTVGYDCVEPPDPCGGVTYEGECDADTLRYCSAEDVVEIDCAAQSQVCGYSDSLGYYDCVDPPTP